MRIQPSGIMTYYVEYDRGKRARIGRAGVVTLTQARNKAISILANGPDEKETKVHTWKSFLDEEYGPWVELQKKTGKATLTRLKACFSEFNKRKLPDMNTWVLDKWRNARLKKGINPATINRDTIALRAALYQAVAWDKLASNPLAKWKQLKEPEEGPPPHLRYDEEKRLRKALEGKGRIRILALVALNTGMRRGELFGLPWRNVKIADRVITVTGKTAKSDKTRKIPMNQEVVDLLREWKKETGLDELVFPSEHGGRLDNVKRAWKTAREAANLPELRFHDLRHTFATNLIQKGVDLETVRDLLGHYDITITQRYLHTTPEHKADAVARLGENY